MSNLVKKRSLIDFCYYYGQYVYNYSFKIKWDEKHMIKADVGLKMFDTRLPARRTGDFSGLKLPILGKRPDPKTMAPEEFILNVENLTADVTDINLCSNKLVHAIPELLAKVVSILQGKPHITEIDLSANKLGLMKPDVLVNLFKSMPYIKALNIGYNQLNQLEFDDFQKVMLAAFANGRKVEFRKIFD